MTKEKRMKILGQIVKNSRISNNLTQEKLSELIEINQSNLSNIENGKNFPSFETLCDLIEATKVSPNELLSFLNFDSETKDILDLELNIHIKSLSKENKELLLNLIKKLID